MSAPPVAPSRRVALCATHAKLPATAACAGCGQFLCGPCGGAQAGAAAPRCGPCRGEGHPIPWEDPALGAVPAYGRTLRAMLGESFFSTAPWTGGLGPPLRFAVISATIGAAATFVWGQLTGGLFAFALGELGPRALAPLLESFGVGMRGFDWSALAGSLHEVLLRLGLVVLALSPLNAALEVLVLGALTLGVSRLLGGKGSYEATVRALGYSAGSSVLSVVPIVGGTLALLAHLILVITGLRRAHGLSVPRAIVAATWWIPVAMVGFVGFAALVVATLVRAT